MVGVYGFLLCVVVLVGMLLNAKVCVYNVVCDGIAVCYICLY